MIRLITVLIPKLIRNPETVKCPEESVPKSERQKLSVTAISIFICNPIFFISVSSLKTTNTIFRDQEH
jgi:hypothetical protein